MGADQGIAKFSIIQAIERLDEMLHNQAVLKHVI
jgi:hypothetical protein